MCMGIIDGKYILSNTYTDSMQETYAQIVARDLRIRPLRRRSYAFTFICAPLMASARCSTHADRSYTIRQANLRLNRNYTLCMKDEKDGRNSHTHSQCAVHTLELPQTHTHSKLAPCVSGHQPQLKPLAVAKRQQKTAKHTSTDQKQMNLHTLLSLVNCSQHSLHVYSIISTGNIFVVFFFFIHFSSSVAVNTIWNFCLLVSVRVDLTLCVRGHC